MASTGDLTMNDISVEQTVLGAILICERFYAEAADLRVGDFRLISHQVIFLRMGDLASASHPIDTVTLAQKLERRNELESVEGIAYLTSLIDGVPDRPSIGHYVRMLREAATRRLAAKLAEKAHKLAADPSVSMAAIVEIGNSIGALGSGVDVQPPRFSEEALSSVTTMHRGCWIFGIWMDGLTAISKFLSEHPEFALTSPVNEGILQLSR